MSLAIKNANIVGRKESDVLIEDNVIKEIGNELEGTESIDAEGKYLLPGFVNTHTHAAMSLFRGYADDLPLDIWLQKKIWPLEEKLEFEDVYWGTKLSCLEMIKSGTVAFNDMYFSMEAAAAAVSDMGMKATLGYGFIDLNDEDRREEEKEKTIKFLGHIRKLDKINGAVAPHAVYTVSREGLEWCAEFAQKRDLLLHIHLAETKKEIDDFDGDRLTAYLDELGLLGKNTLAAHCVWLKEKDIELLSKRGVTVSHNPTSNMKLGVGRAMPYEGMKQNGVRVTLGTDGCASNNNLDLLEEVKIAALLHKMRGDPTALPAEDALKMITSKGAEIMNTNSGKVEEGNAADLILMEAGVNGCPGHNPVSDLIYSFNGSSVTHVLIDGEIVMENRNIEGEDEIIKMAKKRAKDLVRRGNKC